jgi:PhnB protein
MKAIHPYIIVNGRCEEALNFWKEAFRGEIGMMHRFSEGPMPVPAHFKEKIMHAEFRADGMFFMASDGKPDSPPVADSNISLSIDFADEDEQTAVFERLTRGGGSKVDMALEDTFWGARFGMVTDPFGVQWMLNYQRTPKH